MKDVETRLFIAGRYVDAAKSARFADIEPATESELAEVSSASADDVNRAAVAAREAADHGPWPRMSAEARANILGRFADGIEKRARELGMLEARDVGKPVAECVNHDVSRAARNIRFFAAVAQTWTHEAAQSDANFLGRDLKLVNLTERPPVGVAVGQTAQAGPVTAKSFEGMITCSRCGARHQPALDRSPGQPEAAGGVPEWAAGPASRRAWCVAAMPLVDLRVAGAQVRPFLGPADVVLRGAKRLCGNRG